MLRYALLVIVALAGCQKSGASAECPKDLLAARGTSCGAEGKTCTAGPGEQTHFLMCSGGKWAEMNAPPLPRATATASAAP
jgi:hypothetical protein